jgi:hypothetical protein
MLMAKRKRTKRQTMTTNNISGRRGKDSKGQAMIYKAPNSKLKIKKDGPNNWRD